MGGLCLFGALRHINKKTIDRRKIGLLKQEENNLEFRKKEEVLVVLPVWRVDK